MFQLYLGNSIEEMKKIPSNSVDAIITDPPYNTGMDNSNKEYRRPELNTDQKDQRNGGRLLYFFNDKYTPEEYIDLIKNFYLQVYRVLKDDRGIFIFMGWKNVGYWQVYNPTSLDLKNIIVWDKKIHGLGYQNYAHTHEFIMFYTKGNFFPNNKIQEKNADRGNYWKDIWSYTRERVEENTKVHHETTKPVRLLKIMVDHLTKPGDTILDPFMGTGTTGVASLEKDRNFIGIEINQKYYEFAKHTLDEIEFNKDILNI